MRRRERWIAIAAAAGLGAVAQEIVARRYYAATHGPDRFVEDRESTAWTAAWHEIFLPLEWLGLRASATYRGDGVPRGDGTPVVLVHGFLTRGAYLGALRSWLARLGYDARVADIGFSADYLDVLTDRLLVQVRDTRHDTRRRVHIIGHSLGGMLGRAVAARERDLVASLAMLGSPFRGLAVHPALRLGAAVVRAGVHAVRGERVERGCLTLACGCATVRSIRAPLPADLPQLAVASRHDGLADWRYCLHPPTAATVTARSSHMGLVLNAMVYEALARHLALPSARALAAS